LFHSHRQYGQNPRFERTRDAVYDLLRVSVEQTGVIFETPWADSILDTIRDRPAMYVGEKSLTALWYFLQGYQMARSRLGQCETPRELPPHFADWVGYRLHRDGDHDGFWHLAILERVRDEASAVDRFYELRDECFKVEPIIVATIRGDRREFKIGHLDADGSIIWSTKLLPASLKIVVYTHDPGFFLSSDPEEPFFDNGRFFPALSAWDQFAPDRFEIHDKRTWARLIAENAKYKRNLARRRARNQKKQR
jgi:hypothetical protein